MVSYNITSRNIKLCQQDLANIKIFKNYLFDSMYAQVGIPFKIKKLEESGFDSQREKIKANFFSRWIGQNSIKIYVLINQATRFY